MKFLHLADLHIGKKLNEYPLFEDQRHALSFALDLAKKEEVDAIVIAGDVYDSSMPTAEAMEFYDWMLNAFYGLGIPLLLISGNHDSPERLNVASSILKQNGVHIVTKVENPVACVRIKGVNFYLLPYFRPSDVNRAYNVEAKSFEAAMKEVISHIEIDPHVPSVLVTHQAILPLNAKTEPSGSETALDVDANGSVGGTEIIDITLFSRFTYLTLGHIHKAQNVASNARYPGALLKYHVKEANASRSLSVVEIVDGEVKVTTTPLPLKRDLVILEGTLDEVLAMPGNEGNFVHVRLTNSEYVDSPYAKLKARYPFCLGLEYPRLARPAAEAPEFENVEEVDKADLFDTFFETYGGRKLDEQEKEFVSSLLKKGELE